MVQMVGEVGTARANGWSDAAAAVGASLRDGVAERDRDGALRTEVFDELRAAGLTSALVPADRGGGGASHQEMGDVLRVLARDDAATALCLSMHSHLVAAQVWRHKAGMDADAVFAKVVAGAILVSTGASDWLGSSGQAVRVDGGFRVRARKSPASGCEAGQVLVTSIRWDDAPEGPKVLHCSVPMAAEGVRIEPTWDTLGMRATGSHTVVLDDVFVPDAAVSLTRTADVWHPIWNTVIGAAMPLIMAVYLGVADAAAVLALDAARRRAEPHTVTAVGELVRAHTLAADSVDAMFAASDDLRFVADDAHASLTLARKATATDAVLDTVRRALEIVGGSGFSRTSELERLQRDVTGSLFHPLPRARQALFSGRVALGREPAG
jgi:alkylation response protein AidB-like acyl-CoA dehydrogenase